MDPSDIETIMQASDLDLTFSVVELGQENEEILAHLPSMRHYNNRRLKTLVFTLKFLVGYQFAKHPKVSGAGPDFH